jgi:hypothetical protein
MLSALKEPKFLSVATASPVRRRARRGEEGSERKEESPVKNKSTCDGENVSGTIGMNMFTVQKSSIKARAGDSSRKHFFHIFVEIQMLCNNSNALTKG